MNVMNIVYVNSCNFCKKYSINEFHGKAVFRHFLGKVFWDFEKWTKKMSKNRNPKKLCSKSRAP